MDWTVRETNPSGSANFRTRTGRPWVQPASYTMVNRSLAEVKRPGRGLKHTPKSIAEVKERIELRF